MIHISTTGSVEGKYQIVLSFDTYTEYTDVHRALLAFRNAEERAATTYQTSFKGKRE